MRNLATSFWRGVILMCAALGVSLALWWALGWDYAPALIAERIIELTPAEWAVPLMKWMGILAKPWAVAGGVATMALLGGLGAPVQGWIISNWKPGIVNSKFGIRNSTKQVLATLVPSILLLLALLVLTPRVEWVTCIPIVLYGVALLSESGLAKTSPPTPPLKREVSTTPLSPKSEGSATPPSLGGKGTGGLGLTRRAFLIDMGKGILGIAAIAVVGGVPMVWEATQSAVTRLFFTFTPPAPRNPEFAAIEGLTTETTPTDKFYIMSKTAQDPRVQVEEWKLRITGHLRQPLALRLEELMALPRFDQFTTLECVSNPVGGHLMSNAYWSGVRVADLLARAGVKPGAQSIAFYARDSFADSIPFDLAQHPDTLIAYGMNGETLTPIHGAPARLIAPGRYGFKNIKWVERIEVLDRAFRGRWQELGWSEEAIVKTTSRIDTVSRTGNTLTVAGVAFAGARGIQRVEIQLDEGDWQNTELHAPPLSNLTWVQWRATVKAGTVRRVTVRAWDGNGELQTPDKANSFPDGASGWHTLEAEW